MQTRRERERGASLFLAMGAFVFIVPMLGLSVDVAVLYAVKARLQGAVDGAALAAARALTLGPLSGQTAQAQQNAVNWFYANFPSGSWQTSNVVMSTSSVTVAQDPTVAQLRNVTVTATLTAPTYFMRWFNSNPVTVTASGKASRRDVVMMLVLDRSSSMTATACSQMKAAAKLFTGFFAAGRDKIGMVTFSDNFLVTAPTTNFQTVLGYQNGFGSGTGAIDNIDCTGGAGTGSATAMSVAYNELYKANEPGALNVLMLETDGKPNTLTMNFWDSSNTSTLLKSTSTCTDLNTKTLAQGGFASAAKIPKPGWWRSSTTGSPAWDSGVGAYLSDIPEANMIGSIHIGDTDNAWDILKNTLGNSGMSSTYSSSAAGCAFNNGYRSTTAPSDILKFPRTDVWGNDVYPSNHYKSVTLSGNYILPSAGVQNFRNASINALDNAAYQARSNATIPAMIDTILLHTDDNSPDFSLMQRIANDPNADEFNSTPQYGACSATNNCVTYGSPQFQGTFIYSTDPSKLSSAFLRISSQILRLSQ